MVAWSRGGAPRSLGGGVQLVPADEWTDCELCAGGWASPACIGGQGPRTIAGLGFKNGAAQWAPSFFGSDEAGRRFVTSDW